VGSARRVPSREQLLAQLVDARLAGEVATPRANSLSHMDLLAKGDPKYLLGLDLAGHWPTSRIEGLMAKRLGTPPGGVYPASGGDWIDPELVVDALDRMAARLRRAAEDHDVVLVATGHPGGLLEMHQTLAAGLAAAGLTVTAVPRGLSASGGDVRQVGGVAVLHSGGSLLHTHSPRWMQLVLAALAVDSSPRPDLVIADHGWAGAAGQSGHDTLCIADCNDPALFVAEEMGTVSVTVPLEDNAPYELYRPMTAYLLDAAGLPEPDLD
jgi:Phosphatase